MDFYQAEAHVITRIKVAFGGGKPFKLFECVEDIMEEYDLVEGEAQIIFNKVSLLYTRLDFLKEARERKMDPEILLSDQVRELVRNGEEKVPCVKYMRDRMDFGLRKCVSLYDAIVDREAARKQSEERLNNLKGDIDSLKEAMLELVDSHDQIKQSVIELFDKYKSLTK